LSNGTTGVRTPPHTLHHVTIGGADICPGLGLRPGCDANLSLVANEYPDGSVSGQWQDVFEDNTGLHIAVDCLVVVGNQAVVGGVITKDPYDGAAVGLRALISRGTTARRPTTRRTRPRFRSTRSVPRWTATTTLLTYLTGTARRDSLSSPRRNLLSAEREDNSRPPAVEPQARPEQAQPANNPMPIRCADWRWWALVYAGIGVSAAGGQQLEAVAAVTDADTVRYAYWGNRTSNSMAANCSGDLPMLSRNGIHRGSS